MLLAMSWMGGELRRGFATGGLRRVVQPGNTD